ncbi:MAG: hypothetical protein JST29_05555 [Bacteroidetes bacterium]|nr:hypothetical protein [Bacteroidota bacterium]
MLFSKKWANLAFIVVVAIVVSILVSKNLKVLDPTGKDSGNHLGFKATA